jgi:hypothetical protein
VSTKRTEATPTSQSSVSAGASSTTPKVPSVSTSTPTSGQSGSDHDGHWSLIPQVEILQQTSAIKEPESTSPYFVPVTLTSAKNGSVVLSTPAAVTILSTFSGPLGDFVTYTHIIANPPSSISGNQTFESSGCVFPALRGIRKLTLHRFLGNRGAMAAVFVFVGVVAATVVLCIAFFRRHQSLNRRRRWLAGMRQQEYSEPSNPFEDPRNPPEMRSVTDDQPQTVQGSINPVAFNDIIPGSYPTNRPYSGLGLIGVELGISSADLQERDRRSNDLPKHRLSQIDPFLTSIPNYTPIEPSIAQSSPSIYPPSLPSTGDDDHPEVKDWQLENVLHIQSVNIVTDVPPRPPRSLLRRNSKPSDVLPLTLPSSSSSRSSPIVDRLKLKGSQDNILNRRTLLDVRYSHPRYVEITPTFEVF